MSNHPNRQRPLWRLGYDDLVLQSVVDLCMELLVPACSLVPSYVKRWRTRYALILYPYLDYIIYIILYHYTHSCIYMYLCNYMREIPEKRKPSFKFTSNKRVKRSVFRVAKQITSVAEQIYHSSSSSLTIFPLKKCEIST